MSAPIHASRIRSARTAFTLIELLVVVAIISVLVAMAMMAFRVVRSAGDNTHCSSNLRGLSVALLTYSRDFDGRLPYRSEHSEWQDRANEYLEGQSRNYEKGTNLIFHCPFAEKEIENQWHSHAWRFARHYNLNSAIRTVWTPTQQWYGGRKPFKVASLPAKLVLLADGHAMRNGSGEAYFEDAVNHTASTGPWPVSLAGHFGPAPAGTIRWHAKSVNLSCIDGHVERVSGMWDESVMHGRFTGGLPY